MRITEGQLRRIINEELERINEELEDELEELTGTGPKQTFRKIIEICKGALDDDMLGKDAQVARMHKDNIESLLRMMDEVSSYRFDPYPISAEDIVDRWKAVEKKISKLPAERILTIIEKIGNLCKKKELTLTQVQNLAAFGQVVSGEQVMALWKAVSGGKQTNTVKFHKFIQPRILAVATAANKKW
jgi:hypothetical protein